jgi:chromate reductase
VRVLAISGSLRRASYNTAPLRHAVELFAAEGAELEVYDELERIQPFNPDVDAEATPVAVGLLRAAVAKCDGIFFATPEYNSSVPGALKNALDWLSRPLETNHMRNKPVAVIGASTGGFGAVRGQAELRKVLAAIGARVVDGDIAIGHVMSRFDEDGRLNDPNLEEEMREIIRDLLAEIDDRSPEPDTLAAL